MGTPAAKLPDLIHQLDEKEVNRRGFVGMLTGLTVALLAAATPVAGKLLGLSEDRGEASPGRAPIARVEDVPVGKAVTFSYPTPDDPAILVRLESGEFRAYDNRCTHLECPVYWDARDNLLRCPCHEGHFDPTSGKPLAGPPRRPLGGIRISVADGVIYAVGRYEA